MNIENILKTFDYNPETGELMRVVKGGNRIRSGAECNGYLRSMIDGEMIYNHRIAWCHYYREQPPNFIDHIDRDRKNNAIKNLRACTLSKNQSNRGVAKNNTSGFTGVTYMKRLKKYKATIYKDSKPIYLGLFNTAEDAGEAYKKAKGVYHEMD